MLTWEGTAESLCIGACDANGVTVIPPMHWFDPANTKRLRGNRPKARNALRLDSERFGAHRSFIPTPRCLPPNGKQSLDSRPKSPAQVAAPSLAGSTGHPIL